MRLLLTVIALVLAMPGGQAQGVVAESQASGEWGVAPLAAQLNPEHRYALEVDGPDGGTFTGRYEEVYVGPNAQQQGSGEREGTLQGSAPYQAELTPPSAPLIFWRYSVVLTLDEPADLTARIVDLGPR
jgi:hypothetical protein